jgi:hypothetical protein
MMRGLWSGRRPTCPIVGTMTSWTATYAVTTPGLYLRYLVGVANTFAKCANKRMPNKRGKLMQTYELNSYLDTRHEFLKLAAEYEITLDHLSIYGDDVDKKREEIEDARKRVDVLYEAVVFPNRKPSSSVGLDNARSLDR